MKFLQANGLPHPYVMLFLAPLFWATSNVTGKLGKAWLSPYAFTFWRWLLATALLSLLFRRQIRADWPQLKARAGWLFVVGGSGFALFNVVLFVSVLSKLFYMESVLVIGASRAALTMNLLPVFGALIGVAVFAYERLGGYVLVALALVAAGIGLSEWGAKRLAFRRGA